MPFVLVYRCLSLLLLPFWLIGFIVRSFSQPAYRHKLGQRLGFSPVLKPGGIWLHAASVGEVAAMQSLVAQLRDAFPSRPILFTTFTPTGAALAKQRLGNSVHHSLLPIDADPCMALFLRRTKPAMVVLMETELWPVLIHRSASRGLHIALVNGRLSSRSLPRYRKIRSLISPCLDRLDIVLTQSDADQERFVELGLAPEKVVTSGNLKYDIAPPKGIDDFVAPLQAAVEHRHVWCVASCHEDEENLLLDSYSKLRQRFPRILLIVAPRHPERVQFWIDATAQRGWSTVKRSGAKLPTTADDVWLIDTFGELMLFYRLASVCTVAGSFGATGGHTPLEPAVLGVPIVTGPNMQNFADITETLESASALSRCKTSDAAELVALVEDLLLNPQRAQGQAVQAMAVVQANQGATAKTLAALRPLIDGH